MAEPTRRIRLRIAFLLAAAVLAGSGLALLCTAPDPRPVSAAGEAASAVEVIAHRVRTREIRPRTEVAGVLEPRRSVDLFAETNGRILEMGAEALDGVEAEQLLVRVDPRLAQVALRRARAAVARAESELALARLDLKRRRSLAERKATSVAALDQAETAERVAEATLRDARAALEEAHDRVAKKTVSAPFAGVLRAFPVQVGEYVHEGQRIAELLDLEAVRIEVGLSDRQIVAVRPGAPAEVQVEARPGERFAGTVLRVGSATDPASRKFPVQVEVPNSERRLLPGMVARVSLEMGEPQRLLTIPRDASREQYGLRFVYVVEPDGDSGRQVARRRRVEVRALPFQPAEFAVLSGLEEGEEIVLTGLLQLHDGSPVRVMRSDAS